MLRRSEIQNFIPWRAPYDTLSSCSAGSWWELQFFEKFLNIGLKKMFEKLKIDSF